MEVSLLLYPSPHSAGGLRQGDGRRRFARFDFCAGFGRARRHCIFRLAGVASAKVRVEPFIRQHAGSAFRTYFDGWIVAVQVALSVVLVFGAVIAARAFFSVLNVPLGFSSTNVVAIEAAPRREDISTRQFYAQAVESLTRRADVVTAGGISFLPLAGERPQDVARATGSEEREAGIVYALPGYWETLEIPLLRGRLLTLTDFGTASAAVVSESAGQQLFPGRDPLGQTFRDSRDRMFNVVGVVADTLHVAKGGQARTATLDQRNEAPVYVIPEEIRGRLTIVARLRDRQERTLPELKREISAMTPGTVVTVEWWSDWLSNLNEYRNPRFQTIVLSAFGFLALALTALGIFGVVTFMVVSRTREIGIRMALGAEAHSLQALMIRRTLIPVACGLLAGLLGSRWLSRLTEAQLFRVQSDDPLTLTFAVLTVTAAALVAAYLPARRASRVDPITTLGYD
jgi:hypothetical protein